MFSAHEGTLDHLNPDFFCKPFLKPLWQTLAPHFLRFCSILGPSLVLGGGSPNPFLMFFCHLGPFRSAGPAWRAFCLLWGYLLGSPLGPRVPQRDKKCPKKCKRTARKVQTGRTEPQSHYQRTWARWRECRRLLDD